MTVVSVIPLSCRSSNMVFLLRLSSVCSSLWLGVRSCAMYTFLRVRSSSSLRCLAFFKMVFLLLMSVNSTRMGLVSVSNFLPSRLLIIWALSAPKMTHIFYYIGVVTLLLYSCTSRTLWYVEHDDVICSVLSVLHFSSHVCSSIY